MRPSQVQKWVKKTYNGRGNPHDHVALFRQVLRAKQVVDFHTQYEGFELTLEDKALDRFHTLTPEGFTSIKDMVKEFIDEFSQRGIKHDTVARIYNFKQQMKESVRDAASRFKQ